MQIKKALYSIAVAIVVVLVSSTLFACQKPPSVYSVSYTSEIGGRVYGNIHQEIGDGKDGTQVIAVANAGYEFSGWSDGVETPERTETSVGADIYVTAKFKKINHYSVSYISDIGGVIYGDIYQEIAEGNDGTQVIAVANAGYEFSGWSDGVETPERTETSVGADITVTAIYNKIIEHTLIYTSDIGCDIVGDAIQYVRDGKNGATVSVSVKNGHRFVKWSDGVLTRTRKDLEVDDDIDVTAMTEKIVVEFYSDGYLVRRLNLAEINTTDLSVFVGYRSKSEFVGWKYKDEKIVGGSFTDALFSMKQQFNMYGISDTENIKLEAVYENKSIGGGRSERVYNYRTCPRRI